MAEDLNAKAQQAYLDTVHPTAAGWEMKPKVARRLDLLLEDAPTEELAELIDNSEDSDDLDGVESFRLVTGQQELRPVTAPAAGRCTEFTASAQDCALEFAVDALDAPNLVLLLRRGEEVARWDDLR